MPAYKDETRNTWYVKLSYTDYTGRTRQKMKRGFQLRRDAQQWEREFLEQMSGAPNITVGALAAAYLEDLRTHRKASSYISIQYEVKLHVLPAFGDTPVKDVSPANYRAWQAKLKQLGLAESSLFQIDGILRSIFNYAVKYYNLPKSPAAGIPRAGKNKPRGMQFYTLEQFNVFIKTFAEDDPLRVIFLVLFYTGLRVGELLALTPADIDLPGETLTVNKNWALAIRQLTTPKTEKSKRTITLPPFLVEVLRQYMSRFYALEDDTRLFTKSEHVIIYQLRKHSDAAGLPRIRVHDLRHSHASLLINMGIPPAVIAERLGHENVQITLSIYAHLYPNKQRMVSDALEALHGPKNEN